MTEVFTVVFLSRLVISSIGVGFLLGCFPMLIGFVLDGLSKIFKSI